MRTFLKLSVYVYIFDFSVSKKDLKDQIVSIN
ncbi:hypothetical protein FLSI110296_07565 [Flavobacterium sinopsychrotolerans]